MPDSRGKTAMPQRDHLRAIRAVSHTAPRGWRPAGSRVALLRWGRGQLLAREAAPEVGRPWWSAAALAHRRTAIPTATIRPVSPSSRWSHGQLGLSEGRFAEIGYRLSGHSNHAISLAPIDIDQWHRPMHLRTIHSNSAGMPFSIAQPAPFGR